VSKAQHIIIKTDQKSLGAFYTPDEIAEALTDWAILRAQDTFFDPSYGGCSFFRSAINTFTRLGNGSPLIQIFGVDIDPEARKFLKDFPAPTRRANFLHADFFDVQPRDFVQAPFDVICGNPPYIRHHDLTHDQTTKAKAATESAGYAVGQSAGYWVYFVLHALSFLRRGGRLAMVLPTALLSARYAAPLRAVLSSRFAHVDTIFVRNRLFSDAQEGSVIVLAEGWDRPTHVSFALADDIVSVGDLCRNGVAAKRPLSLCGTTSGWKTALLHTDSVGLIDRLSRRTDVHSLGEHAKISIGVVTGANDFFVLRPSEARGVRMERRHLCSVLTSSSQLRRLALGVADFNKLKKSDATCLLLAIKSGRQSAALKHYLSTGKAKKAERTFKCSIRNPWYRIADTATPDAFLTYVNGSYPRLVLNRARATCTNAIHRVWWKTKLRVSEQKIYALSFISTLTQLSAELNGHSYGGGVLKLEPSEAIRLLVAYPRLPPAEIDKAFKEASRLLDQARWEEAKELADKLILTKGLRLSRSEIELLRQSHRFLADLRSRSRAH
jgi:hypothetical protein